MVHKNKSCKRMFMFIIAIIKFSFMCELILKEAKEILPRSLNCSHIFLVR